MVKRTFILGEEWIYLKIYVGSGTADQVLVNHIAPLAGSLVDDGLLYRWFFIRYHDSRGFHIRARFNLVHPRFLQNVLFRIRDVFCPLIQQRLVHAIVFDTYTRELERYGASCYELIEDLFYEDSRCIARLLSIIDEHADSSFRWKSAITLLDDTLGAQGLTTEEKRDLMMSCRKDFREEYSVHSPAQTRMFDRKFRENRMAISEAVTCLRYPQTMVEIMKERKKASHHLFTLMLAEKSPVNTPSLMHMTCNRLFAGFNRLCELTLYEYLSRHYESLLAQEKYNKHE